MEKIASINDCVIRFANVNGSGSASANNLFAKAVFRLGVPVSPKNIFPSNIQGLPTWYEVRVSEKGYMGRRGGADMVVAINSQTLRQDYDELVPGGYFLYDSTRTLPEEYNRTDITVIGIPLTDLCNTKIENPRLRQLLKNIVYVGALASLLDMGLEVFTDSLKRQFKKKPQLAEPNIQALEIGFAYAREHHQDACGLSIQSRTCNDGKIMMDGNNALALGALYAGATVAGWYPITPSTSVIEAFDSFTKRFRLEPESGLRKAAIIQAEDELAAVGMVIGAAWNGARAFTATSGPGLSLMNEFLGLAYFAEIPVLLVDVQRVGPSTGMPTRTQQSDILTAAYASHGDTRHVLLFPAGPRECFEMMADGFDLAERLQSPVIIMSDLDLGMNDWISEPFSWDDARRYDRGKVLSAADLEGLKEWGRYLDVDGDGIGYRTYPGTHPSKGAYFTRGSSHNEYAAYTEVAPVYERGMNRLLIKWETARRLVPPPEEKISDPACRIGAIFFGTSSPAAFEALDILKAEGITVNSLRLRSFPFQPQVMEFINRHDRVFIIEQNRDGQVRKLLLAENEMPAVKLVPVLHFDGHPITAGFISQQIRQALQARNSSI
ncbi:MAG: 2-oxoacid:acceptor oxidoreductase subunit alpha [Desulfocapsaceae bacterium]|nr:2-oxoacid:acceptor oxidoreductase subunit alpha [Desulfocapsaceae bacterium]